MLTLIVSRLINARPVLQAVRQLGFCRIPWRGLAFGFGSAVPEYIGFTITMQFKAPSDIIGALSLLTVGCLGPLAEEVLFRAFGVGTLRDRCGAPQWLALLLPAILFGIWHVGEAGSLTGNLALFAVTGTGGLFFGWFYLRWQRSLWAAFSVHAAMNLTWALFDVSKNAIGGWWPFALQIATIVVAILVTLRFTSSESNYSPCRG